MQASSYPYFDLGHPQALAHRGGALYPPNLGCENTITAFANAISLGYRYLETDVHCTSDGVAVAFHDDRLDRVTDGTGAIAELPWEVVSQAVVGDGERIPRLDELFERFPQARLNIDVKSNSAVVPTAQAILQHGVLERVCVGSFSQRRLTQIRVLLGNRLATAAGGPGIATLRLLPTWVSQWLRTSAPVLQVPATYTIAGREVAVVTPELVAATHRRDKLLHVWTIDDAQTMHDLLDLGVDGIVSDRIDVLRDVLLERGQWIELGEADPAR